MQLFHVVVFEQNFIVKQSRLNCLSVYLVDKYLERRFGILQINPFAFRLAVESKEVARLLLGFQYSEENSLAVKFVGLSLVNPEHSEQEILNRPDLLNRNLMIFAEPFVVVLDVGAKVRKQFITILQKLAVLLYLIVKLGEVIQIGSRNFLSFVDSKELDWPLVVSRLLVGV